MMFTIILAFAVAASDPQLTPNEFWAIVDDRHGEIRDARFNYEFERGKPTDDGQIDRDGGKVLTCRGAYHIEGVVFRETFRNVDGDTLRDNESIRFGGERRVKSLYDDKRRNEQTVRPGKLSPQDLDGDGFWRLWPAPLLRHMPAELRSTTEIVGTETIDGRECVAVSVVLMASPPAAFTHRRIYYVDLERDASVLQLDHVIDGAGLYTRLHSVDLIQIKDKKGVERWFPRAGVVDLFVDLNPAPTGDWNLLAKPTRRTLFRILRETIELNSGLHVNQVELQFDRSIRTIDTPPQEEVRRRAKESRHVRGTVSRADVKRVLEEGEEQVQKIVDGTPRNRTDWGGLFAIGLSLLGLGVLVAAWILNRRRK